MQVGSQINRITNLYVMTPGHLSLLDASVTFVCVQNKSLNVLKNKFDV